MNLGQNLMTSYFDASKIDELLGGHVTKYSARVKSVPARLNISEILGPG